MRLLRLLAIVLLLTGAALAADEFKIDPNHSSVTFSVRHLMISNVPGRFTQLAGTILYDEKDLSKSSVSAVIKAASVNTDNENRDRHLRTADFFDVEKYPEITFHSKRVEKRGTQLVAIGTFTLRGVSKEIELPFDLYTMKSPSGTLIGVSASLKINRKDYGVNYGKILDTGGLQIGDEVKIELNLEARPAPPTPPAAVKPAEKKE